MSVNNLNPDVVKHVLFPLCEASTLRETMYNCPILTIIQYHPLYSHEEALYFFSEHGDIETVHLLVSLGAADDEHILHDAFIEAARNGHLPVVRYLLLVGANIHHMQDYALALAAHQGHLPVVQYLVDQGANVRADYNRALHWARAGGHPMVVQYLSNL